MSGVYTRAVSLLRQVEVVLTEQLGGVDLRALKRETQDAAATKSTISDLTATRWRDVLSAVSPSLFKFGHELRRVKQYTQARKKSIERMQMIIFAIEALVILVSCMSISHVLQSDRAEKDFVGVCTTIAVVLVITLVLFAMFGSWNIRVNEMYRRVRHMEELPLSGVLWLHANTLSYSFIVVVTGAIVSGRNVKREINMYNELFQKVNDAFAPGGCERTARSLSDCAQSDLDLCKDSAKLDFTHQGLLNIIKRFCTGQLVDIAEKLIDLKEFGVDRYDRVVLWRGVHTGIDDLRALIEVPQDQAASALDTGLTRETLPGIIRSEVAPVLKLRGVLLPGGWSVATENWLTPVDTAPGIMRVGGGSRQDCLRACLADANCRFAHYSSGTKMCRHHMDLGADTLRKLLMDEKEPSVKQSDPHGGDPALLIRPSKKGETPTAAESALIVKYDAAMAAGMGAKTLRENASYLAGRLLAVLKRYRFMLDPTHPAARQVLDRELAAYYGASAYGDSADLSSMSAVVDSILQRTQDLVRRARKAPPKYVAPETLVASVHAMSVDEVDDYTAKLRTLRLSAMYHRDLYPIYVEDITNRIAKMLSIFAAIILAMGYTVYVIVLVNMNNRRILSLEQLLQRSLLGMCCFVIAVVVVESMSVKMAARVSHNQRAIDDNSESLVAASIRAHEQFVKLVDLVQRMPSQPQPQHAADETVESTGDGTTTTTRTAAAPMLQIDFTTLGVASALISDAKVAIAKFDMCNSITAGHPRVPKPYAEIVLYGVVGCVFVFAAVLAVYRIAPLKCVDNIRMLSSLRTRIIRGDAAAMHEASGIASCARPPVFIWSIFAWFGLLVFTVLSVFMLFASQDVTRDYRDSLDALEGCTNETGV